MRMAYNCWHCRSSEIVVSRNEVLDSRSVISGRVEGTRPSDPADAELDGRGLAPMLIVDMLSTLLEPW